jgi:hypothetical protein
MTKKAAAKAARAMPPPASKIQPTISGPTKAPRVPDHRMHGERRARSGGAFLKRFRPHLALRRKLESHADAQESVEVGTRVGRELAKRE